MGVAGDGEVMVALKSDANTPCRFSIREWTEASISPTSAIPGAGVCLQVYLHNHPPLPPPPLSPWHVLGGEDVIRITPLPHGVWLVVGVNFLVGVVVGWGGVGGGGFQGCAP